MTRVVFAARVFATRLGAAWLGAAVLSSCGGCGVIDAAGSVVGATVSVAGAVVSTGVTVTGKAVGAVIDAATPSAKPLTAPPPSP